MCCFLASLLLGGPRLGFLILWLTPYGQVKVPLAFQTWIWPLLGLIFLPWTTLAYTIVFPLTGFDWVWLALGFMLDLVTYVGGAMRRDEIPGYSGI